MPRNSSGVYSLPIAAFSSGTSIKSADMNSNLSDIASALTGSLPVNGSAAMTANLCIGSVTTGYIVDGNLGNTGNNQIIRTYNNFTATGTAASFLAQTGTANATVQLIQNDGATPFAKLVSGSGNTGGMQIFQTGNLPLFFYTNGLERGRFAGTGEFGIGGNPSSTYYIDVIAGNSGGNQFVRNWNNFSAAGTTALIVAQTGTSNAFFQMTQTDGTFPAGAIVSGAGNTGGMSITQNGAFPISIANNGVTRLTIPSNGVFRFFQNTTDTPGSAVSTTGCAINSQFNAIFASRGDGGPAYVANHNGDGTLMAIYSSGNACGSITTTGTTTTYNTTSDYRLKENVHSLDGKVSANKVMRLNPVSFNFKKEHHRWDGFLAHEVQSVVPLAATGEYNGAEMQQLDASKLIPIIVSALKYLINKVGV